MQDTIAAFHHFIDFSVRESDLTSNKISINPIARSGLSGSEKLSKVIFASQSGNHTISNITSITYGIKSKIVSKSFFLVFTIYKIEVIIPAGNRPNIAASSTVGL